MKIRSKRLPLLALLFMCHFLTPGKPAWALSIDLHSHLVMQEGMGPLLWGGFDELASASSSDSRFRTKMTAKSLDPSGLKLVVVSFYAHPVLTGGKVKEKLLEEIEKVEKYVAAHPDWVIASEPTDARIALYEGKRVFVFSIETAGGILETKEDQDLFIGQKKVRIVTFVHLSPDRLGRGVALWPGMGIFNSPLEYIEALWLKRRDPETGALLNPYGLSDLGKIVLAQLVNRKVWIDLSHASDLALADMTPVLDAAGQPALVTHSKLREFGANERTTPNFVLERVKNTHGMIGLIPTDDMTKPLSASLASKLGVTEDCREGIRAYAEEWKRARELVGVEKVALGSDFNAPIRGLSGGCASVASDDAGLSQAGFYRGDDLPRLSRALQQLGADSKEMSEKSLAHFLDAWARVRKL